MYQDTKENFNKDTIYIDIENKKIYKIYCWWKSECKWFESDNISWTIYWILKLNNVYRWNVIIDWIMNYQDIPKWWKKIEIICNKEICIENIRNRNTNTSEPLLKYFDIIKIKDGNKEDSKLKQSYYNWLKTNKFSNLSKYYYSSSFTTNYDKEKKLLIDWYYVDKYDIEDNINFLTKLSTKINIDNIIENTTIVDSKDYDPYSDNNYYNMKINLFQIFKKYIY